MNRVETYIGTIAYRRAGAGPPLLLLHGGLGDGRSWTPQLESMAREYDIVAWDAPGCGGSADPAADLRLADYADAVAALVRAPRSDRSTSRGTRSAQGLGQDS
jgi:pimeloyl-ACP methyl ester carboxylesterase